MKSIILLVVVVILRGTSALSQTDSIINLKETDFLIHDLYKVKYEISGETKTEKVPINLEDVKTLTFLGNDSLILAKNHKFAVRTKLSQIEEVTKYKRRISPVLGTAIGVIGGILITGGFMWLVGSGFPKDGILLIIPVGGFIGSAIASSINHTTYDLSLIPDKEKKEKLFKFLRKK